MPMSKEQEEVLARNTQAIHRQALEASPVDRYTDHLEIHEAHGVLRLSFRCSRPDIDDPLGEVTFVVSRVSIPRILFDSAVRKFHDDEIAAAGGSDPAPAP